MKVRVCGVKWIRALDWTTSVIHVADADHIHSDYVRATEIVEIDLPELSADEVLAQVDAIVLTNKAAKLAALQAEIKLLKGE
jgi:hypothetical protein